MTVVIRLVSVPLAPSLAVVVRGEVAAPPVRPSEGDARNFLMTPGQEVQHSFIRLSSN